MITVGYMSTWIEMNTASDRRISLIKFDLSSIPDGATIDSATIYFYESYHFGAQAYTGTLYRIKAANSGWAEGTKNAAAAAAGESCWHALASDGASGITTAWAGDTGSNGGTDAGCSVSGTD